MGRELIFWGRMRAFGFELTLTAYYLRYREKKNCYNNLENNPKRTPFFKRFSKATSSDWISFILKLKKISIYSVLMPLFFNLLFSLFRNMSVYVVRALIHTCISAISWKFRLYINYVEGNSVVFLILILRLLIL